MTTNTILLQMRWELCQQLGITITNLREEWPLWKPKIIAMAKNEKRPTLNKIMEGLKREVADDQGTVIQMHACALHIEGIRWAHLVGTSGEA